MNAYLARVTVLAAALLAGGCSVIDDDLWPSISEPPVRGAKGRPERVEIAAAASERAAQPASAAVARSELAAADAAAAGGPTQVGLKAAEHRRELEKLKGSVDSHRRGYQDLRATAEQKALRYHATVGAINARLQVGTTPGNPSLVSQWNTAQGELDQLQNDIAALNMVANATAGDSATTAYLVDSVRATYQLTGAIDEDHRQLALVEDDVNRQAVTIDRLLDEVTDTVNRQTTYVNAERRNLVTLARAIKTGEAFGASLANRPLAPSAAAPASLPASGSARALAGESRQPLVVIRFDRPDVPYEQALYAAISRALEDRPESIFDLVAVAPGQGSASQIALNTSRAKKHAQDVMRTLSDMGLPAQRVSLSASTSTEAQVSEVRIYIR
ncbi:MAG: hypothetical protein EXQ96_00925 [Alphaproteobacteria bacterium]|nr:hypothetical protein [Alphaproteobacteria bacterium]